MKNHRIFSLLLPILLDVLLILALSNCSQRSERLQSNRNMTVENPNQTKPESHNTMISERRIGKVVFYLENSESMFGYVNGFTEYVDVVSELAEKPRFAEEMTLREFHLINGGDELRVNDLGSNPAILKDRLNINGFRCGDITKSNLNAMFQLALSKAKQDTVSILISDAIYDIGRPQAPMNALSTKGKETRSRFIERLAEGDLQTIIIKLGSHFNGKYFPVSGGIERISQERPFYVLIFGETELLNSYFTEEYIKSLKGFSDVARFLKLSELQIPYQATAHNEMGKFRFDKKNKNKLLDVSSDRNGRGFQFTMATDYSSLPFSDSYLSSIDNYSCSNPNYSIAKACGIDNVKLYGLEFTPTHLITAYTDKSPFCQLKISLLNTIPNWIESTNIDNEGNIIGDTSHTFGFKFLTDAISGAYQYINQESNVVAFDFEILK